MPLFSDLSEVLVPSTRLRLVCGLLVAQGKVEASKLLLVSLVGVLVDLDGVSVVVLLVDDDLVVVVSRRLAVGVEDLLDHLTTVLATIHGGLLGGLVRGELEVFDFVSLLAEELSDEPRLITLGVRDFSWHDLRINKLVLNIY